MELALGFFWQIRQKEVTSAVRPVTVAWDNTNQRTILAMDIAKDHCPKDLWDKLSKPRALIADDLVLKQHLEWESEVVCMTVSGNKQAPCEGGKGPRSNFLGYPRQSCHHPTHDSCGQTKPGSGYQRVCRTCCCQTCLQSTATPAIPMNVAPAPPQKPEADGTKQQQVQGQLEQMVDTRIVELSSLQRNLRSRSPHSGR